jgi:hypothetical protein
VRTFLSDGGRPVRPPAITERLSAAAARVSERYRRSPRLRENGRWTAGLGNGIAEVGNPADTRRDDEIGRAGDNGVAGVAEDLTNRAEQRVPVLRGALPVDRGVLRADWGVGDRIERTRGQRRHCPNRRGYLEQHAEQGGPYKFMARAVSQCSGTLFGHDFGL